MIKKIALSTCIATSIALTACATSTIDSTQSTAPIANKTWIVTHIDGKAISTKPTDRNIPSLQLNSKEQTFSGADGCNRLMGEYMLTATTIKLGPIASSMMACLDENIQTISASYGNALEQAESYQVTPSTLVLKDKDGKAVVQFTTAVKPR